MPIALCDVVENYTQPPWSHDQTTLPGMLFSIHCECCDELLSSQWYLLGCVVWVGHSAKKYTSSLHFPQHSFITMSSPPCLTSCLCLVILSAFFPAFPICLLVFSISMFIPSPASFLFFSLSVLSSNLSVCSLLPVFLSASLLALRTVALLFTVIASSLVYRVWTTFQKGNSKTSQSIWWQLLKVQ